MPTTVDKEDIDWVIEQMALIEDERAAKILVEIQESMSDFTADDLSYEMDEILALAAYIRSFKKKLFP